MDILTSKEIKHFINKSLGLQVKVSTTPTKAKWITAWIRSSSESDYCPKQSFPVDFRRRCLAAVYGADSSLANQTAAGNIGSYSIAMLPHQWAEVAGVGGTEVGTGEREVAQMEADWPE